MKYLLYLAFLFTGLISLGRCNSKKCNTEVWMRYDETQCANPWQFNWFAPPTDEQLAGAVRGYLQEREINILEIRTRRDKEVISCEACTCLNGFHYFVKVQKLGITKLKALNFKETKDIPTAVDNNKQ